LLFENYGQTVGGPVHCWSLYGTELALNCKLTASSVQLCRDHVNSSWDCTRNLAKLQYYNKIDFQLINCPAGHLLEIPALSLKVRWIYKTESTNRSSSRCYCCRNVV